MFELFINNFEKIIGGVLSAAFVGYITYRIYKKTRLNQAADVFRSCLLAELEGFYPVIHSWSGADYIKIQQTIPKVENIAAIFGHFLKGSAKSEFNAAVQEYCNYCKAISKTNDNARAMFDHPSWPHRTDGSEVFNTENFAKHVNKLLSFAKEN